MRFVVLVATLVSGCASRSLDLESNVVVGPRDLSVVEMPDLATPPPDLGGPTEPASCGVGAGATAVTTPIFDQATLGAGSFVESIAVGDLDGDHFVDLVTANRNDFVDNAETISVLLSSGPGSFQPQVKYFEPLYPTTVVLGDFNHDARLDVATDTGSSLQVRLNAGGGMLGPSTSYVDNTRGAWACAAIDVDNDGNLDLVTESLPSSPGGSHAIDVRLGRGDGTFRDAWTLPGAGGEYMAGGDFNEDGYADVVYASQEARTIGIALGQPDGTMLVRGPWALPNAGYPQGLAVGDVDGDHHVDIVVASYNYNGPSTVVVARGDGRGGVECVTSLPATRLPGAIAVGDFNRDGRVDLIVTDYGNDALDFYGGLGQGGFATPVPVVTGLGNPEALSVGDFDQDLVVDVAVGSSMTANVTLLLNRSP